MGVGIVAVPAGRLNRKVRIERQLEVPDGHGGQNRAWTVIGTIAAGATPIGGKEGLQANSLQLSQGWRVEIRPRDITADDRLWPVRWLGFPPEKRLNIRAVDDPEGRGEHLVLLCDTMVTG